MLFWCTTPRRRASHHTPPTLCAHGCRPLSRRTILVQVAPSLFLCDTARALRFSRFVLVTSTPLSEVVAYTCIYQYSSNSERTGVLQVSSTVYTPCPKAFFRPRLFSPGRTPRTRTQVPHEEVSSRGVLLRRRYGHREPFHLGPRDAARRQVRPGSMGPPEYNVEGSFVGSAELFYYLHLHDALLFFIQKSPLPV